MKVAVYDRWWETAGGGEKVAGALAQAFASDHSVAVLGHGSIDLSHLEERLQLDLAGVEARSIDLAPGAVAAASEEFDLLLNASYHSSDRCRAKRGIYYVHFPHPPRRDVGGVKGALVRAARPYVDLPDLWFEYDQGFYPEEMIGVDAARWTSGSATLLVTLPTGESHDLLLRLAPALPGPEPTAAVTIRVDGVVAATYQLSTRAHRFDRAPRTIRVPLVGRGEDALRVEIVSPSWVPSEQGLGEDSRRLSIAVTGVRLGDALRSRIASRFPSLVRRPDSLAWIESYDQVLANSVYTAAWVAEWWHLNPAVLNPPVTPQIPADKSSIILNVGRFFASTEGHSKKQLELVRAFSQMVDQHRAAWELHFVGGCESEDRAYLERVRHAAKGLPVTFHVNASGADLKDLYARAAIYWHASGFGEDEKLHPDRFEHFGITTVEAMSAGAVPIVLGRAGQREVVEDHRSGFHWTTIDGLLKRTVEVISDEALREQMSHAAIARAEKYSLDNFQREIRRIADELGD